MKARPGLVTGIALIVWGSWLVRTFGEEAGVFVDIQPVRSAVNSLSFDADAQLSGDGLTLYFASTRPWQEGIDIEKLNLYYATRTRLDAPFSHVKRLDTINSPAGDTHPSVTFDGLRLYFSSHRSDPEGQGDWDLWVASRDRAVDDLGNRVPFGEVKNLGPAINSATVDVDPTISCDGKVLVFASIRDGGVGSLDLWMATLDNNGELDGELVNLGSAGHQVNSEFADAIPGLSCDALTLFFSDESFIGLPLRPDGHGGDDLWIATRPVKADPFGAPANLESPLVSVFDDISPVPSFDWPADHSLLFFASNRPHPLARGGFDTYQATWLDARGSSDITFEPEAPRTAGAINCGGGDVVSPPEELGLHFMRDRFVRDRTGWRQRPEGGLVVSLTTLGHVRIDDKNGGSVFGADHPRPIDVSQIPGAGDATAPLFATSAVSPNGLHYEALVEPGRYAVHLYFAESSPEGVNGFGQGTRLLDVSLGGDKILCNWSAAAAAGSLGGSGNPQVADNALLDTAIVRTFFVDVPDDDPRDDQLAGTLNIIVEGSTAAGVPSDASLNAFSFARAGDVTGDPAAGDIECIALDPHVNPETESLAMARTRFEERGELYINCGGPMLCCSATESPAPAITEEAGIGEPVIWLADLTVRLEENEFFSVNGGFAFATDMGFWDARGTQKGLDQNDRIFHTQRQGNMQYDLFLSEGRYELTLYFANASWRTAGTAQRFFCVAIGGEPQEDFEHCEFSGRDEEGHRAANPTFGWDHLYDPVDHADQFYSENRGASCEFTACETNGIAADVATAAIDPDGDGLPAEAECGNAAATALRFTVDVGQDPLTVALTGPDLIAGEPVPPEASPILSGLRARMLREDAFFIRGDVDASGKVNITDAVFTLNHLFLSGPAPTCSDAADADDNGKLQISDPIFTLNRLFLGGLALPPPGPDCGPDPIPDELTCEVFGFCVGQ